jgi:hypothetical protein
VTFWAAIGMLLLLHLMVVVNSQWYLLVRTLINQNMFWWALPAAFYGLLLGPFFLLPDHLLDKYTDFIELLYDIKRETTINSKQLTILIELNFFEEFGDRNYLLQVCALYDKWADRKTFKKEDAAISGIPLELIRQFAGKESEKQFSQMDMKPLIHNLAEHLQYVPHTLNELINSQVKYLGYVDIPPDPKYSGYAVVLDVDTKFSPKVKLHSLKNGTLLDCKINKKTFAKYPLEIGNIINIHKVNKKPKVHKNDAGKWVEIPGTSELWVTEYNPTCLK